MKILNKFKPECKYSIDSSKKFKKWFLKEKSNLTQYGPIYGFQILTLDIVKLYPSVDIEFTINYIVDKFFENPELNFEKNINEDENSIFPNKELFKKFITQVLTQFTSFECLSGYYKQSYMGAIWDQKYPLL